MYLGLKIAFLKYKSWQVKGKKKKKKEVEGRRAIEWILITPLMPNSIWHKSKYAQMFHQCHGLPFNGLCDLQADLGHFLKDAAV